MKWQAFVLGIFIVNAFLLTANTNQTQIANDLVFPLCKADPAVHRILTYNIRGESKQDRIEGNLWRDRKYQVATLIQTYDPDIFALQGVQKFMQGDLTELFPEFISISTDDDEEIKDVVLFLKKNRFSINHKQVFWLTSNPDIKKAPSGPSWGGNAPRLVLETSIHDHHIQKDFIVFSTHFDSAGMESRINGARILSHRLVEVQKDLPMILLGDFNFMVSTEEIKMKSETAYEMILCAGLKDVRSKGELEHFGPDGTWIGWKYDRYAVPDGKIGERLDHIFVRGFSTLMDGVLDVKISGSEFVFRGDETFSLLSYPSDHLPVIADLIIANDCNFR